MIIALSCFLGAIAGNIIVIGMFWWSQKADRVHEETTYEPPEIPQMRVADMCKDRPVTGYRGKR